MCDLLGPTSCLQVDHSSDVSYCNGSRVSAKRKKGRKNTKGATMATKILTQEECQQANDMRSRGKSDKEIARYLRVTTRTLRDSCGTRRAWRAAVDEVAKSVPLPEHKWNPDWQAADLARDRKLDEQAASRILGAGRRAQKRGDLHLFAFICRWIANGDDPEAPPPFNTFLAGLPVLGAAMKDSVWNEVHNAILEHRPYRAASDLSPPQVAKVLHPRISEAVLTKEEEEGIKRYQAIATRYRMDLRSPLSSLRESVEDLSYQGLIGIAEVDDTPYEALTKILQMIDSATGIVDGLAIALGGVDPEPEMSPFRLFAQVLVSKSITGRTI